MLKPGVELHRAFDSLKNAGAELGEPFDRVLDASGPQLEPSCGVLDDSPHLDGVFFPPQKREPEPPESFNTVKKGPAKLPAPFYRVKQASRAGKQPSFSVKETSVSCWEALNSG